MLTSATRLDTHLHAPERKVVSILGEVFGRQVTGGPRWIMEPSRQVQNRFWNEYGARVTPDQSVFVAEGVVPLDLVLDLHDRPLPALGDLREGDAWLFFVDIVPEANWGHPCAYVLFFPSGESRRIEHRWPPSESIRLIPLARPPSLP